MRIIDVSLIDRPETLARSSDTITVVGMLKATIETDFNLIEYAKANEKNLWYKVKGCDSGLELDGWSRFYTMPSTLADMHRYMVVFDYKSLPRSDRRYNLALQPEPLCFVVGIANMNLFTAREARMQRYELPEQLEQALLSYEQGEGPIKFERKQSTSSAH